MAKNKKRDNNVNVKNINRLSNGIQNVFDLLYKNTYFTTNDNKNLIDNLKNNIDDSVDKIINSNETEAGMSNISRIYARIRDSQGDTDVKDIVKELSDSGNMSALLSMYLDNKYIKEIDDEIDIVCKYMPQLKTALTLKKDNILSADKYTKDFISVENNSTKTNEGFNNNIDLLKEKYNLLELIEDIYDETATYGEAFYYVVPYGDELTKLQKDRDTFNSSVGFGTLSLKEGVITESFDGRKTKSKIIEEETETGIGNLNVTFHYNSILNEATRGYSKANDVFTNYTFETMRNMGTKEADKLAAADGLLDVDEKARKRKQTKLNVPGCIVKRLERANIIPIYIEDMCLGYYYIECDSDSMFDQLSSINDPTTSMKQQKQSLSDIDNEKDELLKNIAGKLSTVMDNKFINANQDLKKEIYLILKYNQLHNSNADLNMKIDFLPADTVMHFYFRKNKKTNRGISDLHDALIAGKLFACLYITNTLAVLTRGSDKRVYYIKQAVDTNIAQTMMNTINQIKKSNFGLREINNLSNILNVVGRFNDLVIPLSASGDSPIQFELMQGQDIPIKTELMDLLESMAVNSTDVPLELVQNRSQVDYSQRLTMTNINFLRVCLKRQSKVQLMCTKLLNKIYMYEFGEQENIKVLLPAPVYQHLTNMPTLVQNVADYANNILIMEYGEADAEHPLDYPTQLERNKFFRKICRHQLSTIINLDLLDEFKQQAKVEAAAESNYKPQEQEEY